jgi:SPP1 family predicted phage head-tail adaptor
MRAGKLDKVITFQRFTSTVDDFGTPVETWADIADLRAQVVQSSTEEFIRAGAESDTVIIFRTRFLDGVTTADRIKYAHEAYFNIKELKEIGRRQGLEIRCVRSE